ncbi:hypothetical protein H0N99_00660 [Candidatus Micrarchaeota archaeon]|nr:hypothetical protein [Candidatus Micrarchaeota archaeon]
MELKLMSDEHTAIVQDWYEKGIALGYKCTKEFKVDDKTTDSIDCVLERGEEKIFIEVENSGFGSQTFKNMTKGLHLKPTKIIFDCKRLATAKQIEKRKNRVNIPIEVICREDGGRRVDVSKNLRKMILDVLAQSDKQLSILGIFADMDLNVMSKKDRREWYDKIHLACEQLKREEAVVMSEKSYPQGEGPSYIRYYSINR